MARAGCAEYSVGPRLGCRYAKDAKGCCENVPGADINKYCLSGADHSHGGNANNGRNSKFYRKEGTMALIHGNRWFRWCGE